MRGFLSMIALAVVLVGCDSSGSALTLGPASAIEITFGTENYDAGHALLQTSQGDLLIAGAGNGVIAPADGTIPTPSLTRVDENGTIRWTRVYDTLQYGAARAVVEAAPNQFVLLTEQHDAMFNQHQVSLWTTDADGTLGDQRYHRPGASIAYSATRPLVKTSDGGFLLVGENRPNDRFDSAFAERLNADGTLRWRYQAERTITFDAVLALPDGEALIAGTNVVQEPSYAQYIVLVRLDASGQAVWSQSFHEVGSVAHGVALTPAGEGTFLLTSTYRTEQAGDLSYGLVASFVDAAGTLTETQRLHIFPDQSNAAVRAATPLTDGGYALTGWMHNRNASKAFALSLDPNGALRWFRAFEAKREILQGHDVLQLSSGALALTGTRGPDMPTFGGADFDAFLFTFGTDGSD